MLREESVLLRLNDEEGSVWMEEHVNQRRVCDLPKILTRVSEKKEILVERGKKIKEG